MNATKQQKMSNENTNVLKKISQHENFKDISMFEVSSSYKIYYVHDSRQNFLSL